MLVADNITVTFANRRVLNSVNLAVAAGEIIAVLGASGSGKSTLLRSLCGLQPIDAGRVAWRSTDGVETELTSVAAHRRSVGMMFQDHLLFPHLDVARNVAYGLATGAGSSTFGRRGADGRRGRQGEDDAVVRDLLAIVGLQGFEERQIATLSGGEQQRVALARSLAPQPRALLLDEPFGALDRGRREQLVDDVARIVRSRNVATIVVTHDHDEAFTLADRIAVLVDGCIVQLDTAHKVWVAPASIEVCQLLGFGNPETVWCEGDRVEFAWGTLRGFDQRCGSHGATTTPRLSMRAVLRPDAFSIETDGELEARVERILPRGDELRAVIRIAGTSVRTVAVPHSTNVGAIVRVSVDREAVLLYSNL